MPNETTLEMDCKTCALTLIGGTSVTYRGQWLLDGITGHWVFLLTEPLKLWSSLPITQSDWVMAEYGKLCIGWRSLTRGEYTTTTNFSLQSDQLDKSVEVSESNPSVGDLPKEEPIENNQRSELVCNEVVTIDTTPYHMLTFFAVSTEVRNCIMSVCKAANSNHLPITKEDRCRLKFLKDTVELIVKLVNAQPQEVRLIVPFAMLVQNITSRMEDVLVTLKRIEKRESVITDNFDIFELKLRSHWEEMASLFPPGDLAISSPWSIITDEKARDIWIKLFGDKYYITFDQLIQTVNTELVEDGDEELTERMVKCLRYLVNFPADDMITTYKFDQLVCLFGFHDFRKNFQNLTEKTGFCGLINRIQAFEILTVTFEPYLLFRMSRTEPRFFAFSYRTSNGQIAHRLNKDKRGNPIQVDAFIRDKFPRHKIVNKRLDLDRIFDETSSATPLSDYASSAGYCY